MNVLFVNYGISTNNSMNHMLGFAKALRGQGHECVIAVSKTPSEGHPSALSDPIPVITYQTAIQRPCAFPNSLGPDVIHAWTPREGVGRFVRRFGSALPRTHRQPCLVVHLEDNEQAITARSLSARTPRKPLSKLLPRFFPPSLSHPTRSVRFLASAAGVTVIIRALEKFVPSGIAACEILPPIDFDVFRPPTSDCRTRTRARLGIDDDTCMITYPGNANAANLDDMYQLYETVAGLNHRGHRTRLIRTGADHRSFDPPPGHRRFVTQLGMVDRSMIPDLIGAGDVMIQPGRADEFNDFRLPSKIPEFLACGRPTILPKTNIGLRLEDGVEALLTTKGTVDELIDKVRFLIEDQSRAEAMGNAGRLRAMKWFDSQINSAFLESFYREVAR